MGKVSGGIRIRGETLHSNVRGSQIMGEIVCARSFRNVDGSPLEALDNSAMEIPGRVKSRHTVQCDHGACDGFNGFGMPYLDI